MTTAHSGSVGECGVSVTRICPSFRASPLFITASGSGVIAIVVMEMLLGAGQNRKLADCGREAELDEALGLNKGDSNVLQNYLA